VKVPPPWTTSVKTAGLDRRASAWGASPAAASRCRARAISALVSGRRRHPRPAQLRSGRGTSEHATEQVEHRVQGPADEEQVAVAAAGEHFAGTLSERVKEPQAGLGRPRQQRPQLIRGYQIPPEGRRGHGGASDFRYRPHMDAFRYGPPFTANPGIVSRTLLPRRIPRSSPTCPVSSSPAALNRRPLRWDLADRDRAGGAAPSHRCRDG
jgi:hypothetical protein